MVSANPQADSGGSVGGGAADPHQQQPQEQQQKHSGPLGMAVPGLVGSLATAAAAAVSSSSEDPNKKIRKPYTITKSRESWTEQEHDKFLEALQLFDRDWKKIESFVGSKTVIQIRSHAQKYFLKVQKSGTSEHVPPPRPKRKAAHPYPQKAPKNSPLLSQPTAPFQAPACLLEPGYAFRTDSSSVLRNSGTSGPISSWDHNSVQLVSASHTTKEDIEPAGDTMVNNCCSSSTESPPRTWQTCESTDQVNHVPSLRAMPDFSQVYSFIGSMFDPSTNGHLEKLKEMNPIDVETVLLLMRNLSVNLTSPDFVDHRRLLSAYDAGTEEVKHGSSTNSLEAHETMNASFMVKGE